MGLDERIKSLRDRIDEEIRECFRDKKPSGLYDPMLHLLNSGGKRLRPLMLILSCQAVGGNSEDCLSAAAAVEILHTFTLVHDDIMDHDDIRRGRPTVHKQWDESTAILAGDGLVTLAFQTMLHTNHPQLIDILKTFTDGLLLLCEGQAMDKAFEHQETITLEAYEEMIDKKTAKLMEVVCEIGAILGNASNDERDSLRRFGFALGRAFQIQDDALDLMQDESVTGKPLGSDIIEGKKTYLTIYFQNHASFEDIRNYQSIIEKKSIPKEAVYQIRDLFERAGTFEAAKTAVNRLINQALDSIDRLRSSTAKEDLRDLAVKIQNRVN